MSRQSMTDRMIVEIVMRHKDRLLQTGEEKARAQKDINRILDTLVQKTGRDVSALQVVKKNGKFKLVLEIK